MSTKVWNLVEEQSKRTDTSSTEKKETYELYGSVASLYHTYRPRYPEELIVKAIDSSPLLKDKIDEHSHILEIGCGPGTVTLQLLQRGFRIHAFDPSSDMIEQAKTVCQDFSGSVHFEISTLQSFESSDQKYDAIVAASSLHWALAEPDPMHLIQKLSNFLKPSGTLILLWNFPFQPSEALRDVVADAIGKPKPFFFPGVGRTEDHVQQLDEKVLRPLSESKFFGPIESTRVEIEEEIAIKDFFSFLNTLSMYIKVIPADEKQHFFADAEKAILEHFGSTNLQTTRSSILNVLKKKV